MCKDKYIGRLLILCKEATSFVSVGGFILLALALFFFAVVSGVDAQSCTGFAICCSARICEQPDPPCDGFCGSSECPYTYISCDNSVQCNLNTVPACDNQATCDAISKNILVQGSCTYHDASPTASPNPTEPPPTTAPGNSCDSGCGEGVCGAWNGTSCVIDNSCCRRVCAGVGDCRTVEGGGENECNNGLQCTGDPTNSPSPIPDPVLGVILGRVWNDINGDGYVNDGVQNSGIQSSSYICPPVGSNPPFVTVDGLVVQFNNGINSGNQIVNRLPSGGAGCSVPENIPYYAITAEEGNDYIVELTGLPIGWSVVSVSTPQGYDGISRCSSLGDGRLSCFVTESMQTHAWFGIAQVQCTISSTNNLNLQLGGTSSLYTQVDATGGSVTGIEAAGGVAFVSSDPNAVSLCVFGPCPPGTSYTDPENPFLSRATGHATGSYTVNMFGNMEYGFGDLQACTQGTATVTVTNPIGWWQAHEGSVVAATGNITSTIPASCSNNPDICDANVISFDAGDDPGVVTSGGQVTSGSGDISDPINWMTENDTYAGVSYDFDYFRGLISSANEPAELTNATITQSNLTTGGTLVNGYYLYKYTGAFNATIDTTGVVTNLGNRKVILFVENPVDITIADRIQITNGTGFFAIFSPGDILVSSSVGGTVADLEGVYFTDGEFSTGSAGSSSDIQLTIRGMVAANSVSLQRDLGGADGNSYDPAERFVNAPDILLNFPSFLSRSSIDWKEIAP